MIVNKATTTKTCATFILMWIVSQTLDGSVSNEQERKRKKERRTHKRARPDYKCIFTYESRSVHMERHIIRCTCYRSVAFSFYLMRKWNIFNRWSFFFCRVYIITSSTIYVHAKSNFSVPIQRALACFFSFDFSFCTPTNRTHTDWVKSSWEYMHTAH